MDSCEREQTRLLMEEVLIDEKNIEYDDEEEDEENFDNVEARGRNSDTEQEMSDTEEIVQGIQEPYFLEKVKRNKWQKMVPKKSVRTRSENIIKLLAEMI
ncbi:hypothetical protein FQR65_LT17272 [Abscondita terminalis]|nr:hypothetical protein FQR65_LT17272 [Abscondita terminalis]